MSLVFTLASRNLLQDRLRFIGSLLGIVVSVVLVMVQAGLFFGFGRMVTAMIDHAPADLWVLSSGAKYFEDLSLVDSDLQPKLGEVDGVATVAPLVVGFSAWMQPDGRMTSIFVVGSDATNGAGLQPWNVVAGNVDSLREPTTVAVDHYYLKQLDVRAVGDGAQIRAQPATVGAITQGIRAYTTAPYVFAGLADARGYTGLPDSFTSFFLVRLKPGADLEKVRQEIATKSPSVHVLTPQEFSDRSRSYWLFGTGAGIALVIGALLALIVGVIIVAQTLYSSTKEHLYEFATLRAIGASNYYVYRVIIYQALLNAVIGFAIAALLGYAIMRFSERIPVQIEITPKLMIALFGVTIVMCVLSGIAAVYRVIRVDPAVVLTR